MQVRAFRALAAHDVADSLHCLHSMMHRDRHMRRALSVCAGVLPPGLEDATFICDGTKDLGSRSRIYDKQERDYSANKGHGKSHLLFCDLFGKVCARFICISASVRCAWLRSRASLPHGMYVALPSVHAWLQHLASLSTPFVLVWQPLHVAAGIQGNENDRGAYLLTKIYQHPDDYMLPHHQGLFDGVFRGALHCKTDASGILPFNQSDLRGAAKRSLHATRCEHSTASSVACASWLSNYSGSSRSGALSGTVFIVESSTCRARIFCSARS